MHLKFFDPEYNLTVLLKVQETFAINFYSHGSVGWSARYEIGNEALLLMKEEKKIYENETLQTAERKPKGGNKAEGVFVFQGLQVGETDLFFYKCYRFKDQEKARIKVVITQD
ncbi:MAG: hypothetical protein IT260_24125 [Saprospiraceae bacterium]|nr:hypothetical protein [Saprospiraceae bacterium]